MRNSDLFSKFLTARVRWKQHKRPAFTVRDALYCLDLSDPVHEAWLEHAASHTFRTVSWAPIYRRDVYDRMVADYTSYMLQLPTWPASVPRTSENVPPIKYVQIYTDVAYKSHFFVNKPAVNSAAAYIQAAWRGYALRKRRLANPADPLCRKRLLREFEGMNNQKKLKPNL